MVKAQFIEFSETSPLAFAVAKRDSETLSMVKEAIRHKQVHLAFQPVVQTRRRTRVAFYEALIRVEDASGRIIPAVEFLPEIETHETGRILDCLALESSLQILEENPRLRLSVNMSARSIGYRNWMSILEGHLGRNPSLGARLILEITERSAMLVPELVIDFMRSMQRLDVAFALDDFGAGFTSFRYFRDFQFDMVKMDRTVVHGISKSADSEVLLRALNHFAHEFDLLTVAEGVERSEDATLLEAVGVDCLQGYLFGAPTVSPPWMDDAPAARPA